MVTFFQLFLSTLFVSGILCLPQNSEPAVRQIGHEFLVSIYTGTPPTKICAGSILNEKWILTAADCAEDLFGKEDAYITAGEAQDQKIQIKNAIKYPVYIRRKSVHNVGLVCLDKPLTFDDHVNSIGIPRQYIIPEKTGYIFQMDEENKELTPVHLPVIEKVVCLLYYEHVNESHVCAGEPGKNSCPNDIGAPLVQLKEGKKIVAGIHTFTQDICAQKVPTTFVRVSRYTNWIKGHIENDEC